MHNSSQSVHHVTIEKQVQPHQISLPTVHMHHHVFAEQRVLVVHRSCMKAILLLIKDCLKDIALTTNFDSQTCICPATVSDCRAASLATAQAETMSINGTIKQASAHLRGRSHDVQPGLACSLLPHSQSWHSLRRRTSAHHRSPLQALKVARCICTTCTSDCSVRLFSTISVVDEGCALACTKQEEMRQAGFASSRVCGKQGLPMHKVIKRRGQK